MIIKEPPALLVLRANEKINQHYKKNQLPKIIHFVTFGIAIG